MAKPGKHALFKQTLRELKHLSWLEQNLSGSKQLRNSKLAVFEKRTALCNMEGSTFEGVARQFGYNGKKDQKVMDESTLSKGQLRKLEALRKSLGVAIADDAFGKWLKAQPKMGVANERDAVAEKLVEALSALESDKSFRLGRKGYVVRRAKGKNAKGFVAVKLD
jgi:hypothetical protein